MENKVKAEIYYAAGMYVPVEWGKEKVLKGYPVGGSKSGCYLYFKNEEFEEGKLICDGKDYQFQRLITVCCWQKRLENEGLDAIFGMIIPAEREAEFLDFIGVKQEDIPTAPEKKTLDIVLDGRYEHENNYKNINTMFYNGKEYKI